MLITSSPSFLPSPPSDLANVTVNKTPAWEQEKGQVSQTTFPEKPVSFDKDVSPSLLSLVEGTMSDLINFCLDFPTLLSFQLPLLHSKSILESQQRPEKDRRNVFYLFSGLSSSVCDLKLGKFLSFSNNQQLLFRPQHFIKQNHWRPNTAYLDITIKCILWQGWASVQLLKAVQTNGGICPSKNMFPKFS